MEFGLSGRILRLLHSLKLDSESSRMMSSDDGDPDITPELTQVQK